MSTFRRAQVQQLVQRITAGPPRRINALIGPRQTGKSTIAIQTCDILRELGYECRYYQLDEPVRNTSLLRSADITDISEKPTVRILVDLWVSARREAWRNQHGLVLVLDEIHRIPDWSYSVKGLWDSDRRNNCPLHVVVLGSGTWAMMTGIGEGLVGRFSPIHVTHWSFSEMAGAFDLSLDKYLFYGGFPGPQAGLAKTKHLFDWRSEIAESILGPIIGRDILGFTPVRKPALMRQMAQLLPDYSGQILSFDKMLGLLKDAGNATTVADYLNLLSDAGLVAGLFRYTPAPHKGRQSPPKILVQNTALMTAPSGKSSQEIKSDRAYWGQLVESAVGVHLYNTKDFVTKLHYWRESKSGHEVDFVVTRGSVVLGIEVKTGRPRGTPGLAAFKQRFPQARVQLVGPGGIPLSEFLSYSTAYWLQEA